MFADELRRAVEAAPRVKLPDLSGILWKAFAAGQVTEEEASQLSDLIETRKAVPAATKPAHRRVGSRPRSSASMERRRSWAAAGRFPPALAARFTLAEQAVLAVVASEVSRKGSCELTNGHIAALAGVCVTVVKNAMRAAQGLGLLRIEERRLTAWRNLPNRVSITSPEWLSWLRIGPKGGGGRLATSTGTSLSIRNKERRNRRANPANGSARNSEKTLYGTG